MWNSYDNVFDKAYGIFFVNSSGNSANLWAFLYKLLLQYFWEFLPNYSRKLQCFRKFIWKFNCKLLRKFLSDFFGNFHCNTLRIYVIKFDYYCGIFLPPSISSAIHLSISFENSSVIPLGVSYWNLFRNYFKNLFVISLGISWGLLLGMFLVVPFFRQVRILLENYNGNFT